MVEGAALEMLCTFTGTESSNLSVSAIFENLKDSGKRGRVVDAYSLENCRSITATVSSNLTASVSGPVTQRESTCFARRRSRVRISSGPLL